MNRRKAIQNVALLVGGTLSAGTLAALLDGCHTASSTTDNFTEDNKKTIAEIAEMIIPRTDTPGAKDAAVPAFIVMMINECYPDEARKYFIAGLNDFDKQCKDKYGKHFYNCSDDQKKEMLTQTEKEVFGGQDHNNKKDKPTPFYRTLKELTLFGYFTSEPGATKALAYVAIPGKYVGCEPLKPGQKAWAL